MGLKGRYCCPQKATKHVGNCSFWRHWLRSVDDVAGGCLAPAPFSSWEVRTLGNRETPANSNTTGNIIGLGKVKQRLGYQNVCLINSPSTAMEKFSKFLKVIEQTQTVYWVPCNISIMHTLCDALMGVHISISPNIQHFFIVTIFHKSFLLILK